MADRRYDDEEVRQIFDKAAQAPESNRDGASLPSSTGFSLAELQEIGAEAGLDPARIAEAAHMLDGRTGASAAVRRLGGLPIGVARTVPLGSRFDEDDWNRLVVDLRETFAARGTITVQGAFREWRNGNLHALVEPGADGYRLRLHTVKGSANAAFRGAAVSMGLALLLAVAFVVSGPTSDEWLAPAFMAVFGLVMAGGSAVRLPGWARERAHQMEEVANRALLRAEHTEGEPEG